jgi:hypothetical protein
LVTTRRFVGAAGAVAAAAWVTVNVRPAIVSVPDRVAVVVFVATL